MIECRKVFALELSRGTDSISKYMYDYARGLLDLRNLLDKKQKSHKDHFPEQRCKNPNGGLHTREAENPAVVEGQRPRSSPRSLCQSVLVGQRVCTAGLLELKTSIGRQWWSLWFLQNRGKHVFPLSFCRLSKLQTCWLCYPHLGGSFLLSLLVSMSVIHRPSQNLGICWAFLTQVVRSQLTLIGLVLFFALTDWEVSSYKTKYSK